MGGHPTADTRLREALRGTKHPRFYIQKLQSFLEPYRRHGSASINDEGDCLVVHAKGTTGSFLFSEPLAHAACVVLHGLAGSTRRILLLGRTGSGKSYLMKFVMALHPRECAWIDCSTVPETLFESHLFGHTPNAFTGAGPGKSGPLDGKRILLLDEIGNTTPTVQGKLLGLVGDFSWSPVGSNRPRRLPEDAFILATTNIDIEDAIREGTFREDLVQRFQRRMEIPRLEAWGAVLVALAETELAKRRPPAVLSEESKRFLATRFAPDSMRQLHNVVGEARDNMELECMGGDLPQELLAPYLQEAAEACGAIRQEDGRAAPARPGTQEGGKPTGEQHDDVSILTAFRDHHGKIKEAAPALGCSVRRMKDRIREMVVVLGWPKLEGLMSLASVETLVARMNRRGVLFVKDLRLLDDEAI